MKDKLITYAVIIVVIIALFNYAWPVIRGVVLGQVNRVDDTLPNTSLSAEITQVQWVSHL